MFYYILLKVNLFVLAALVLLSAIGSVLTNMPIGANAQEYENSNDDSYGNNGIDEEYYYDQQNIYNEAMDLIEPTYSLNYKDYENEYTPDDESYYNEEPILVSNLTSFRSAIFER